MILGFKTTHKGQPTGFVDKIESGSKIHSMRKGNRWKRGMSIQFATGIRTKKYKKFKDGFCLGVQKVKVISLEEMNRCEIWVDGRRLGLLESQRFAWNDGFDNLVQFWLWFTESEDYQLIHWTNKKY